MARKFLVKNMGSVDRALRAFVITPAAIIAAVAFGASSIGGIVLFVVAGIALPTAAVSRCPSYVLFGIDTHGGGRAHTPLPL